MVKNIVHQLPVLVEVRRGPIVESRHRGAIIALAGDGTDVASLGDGDLVTSTRSTIKPVQAIPFIASGTADRFSCSEEEIALACASHEGEPIHTELVSRMLARAGLQESALRCGAHAPFSAEAARNLEQEGLPFTQLHNNCSGKHAAMLLTAAHQGLTLDDYYKPEHPVQKAIVAVMRTLGGLADDPLFAVDGCSAPTFAIPLRAIALAFARLANPHLSGLGTEFENAAPRIVSAMINNPVLIGGSKGRFDTDLLRASGGKLICKVGAEAVYGIGVLPTERYTQGLGIAIKIEDGSYRGLGPTVVEALMQLKVLETSELSALETYWHPKVDNRRGLVVGEVAPIFTL
jgi:L-asparaginase II